MSAPRYDFTIEQGTSFKLSLIYKDSEGNPIDITGWCGRLTWRTNTNDITVFHSNNTNDEEYKLSLDGPTGTITFMLPACVTNNYTFSSAKYDLELESNQEYYYPEGDNFTTRILKGSVTIEKRKSGYDVCLYCEP